MLSNSTKTRTSTLASEVRAMAPYAGLAANQCMSAPKTRAQGTAVSFAGFIAADVSATPGSPPREAPV